MGASQSRNLSQSITRNVVNATTRVNLNCSPQVTQLNDITFCRLNNVKVDIPRINQSNTSIIRADCQQTAEVQQQTEQRVRETVQQAARAARSTFNIGLQSSSNVNTSFAEFQAVLTTAASTTCNPGSTQVNNIKFCDANGAEIGIGAIDQTNRVENMVSCIQNFNGYQAAAQSLDRAINQKAVAEGQGLPNIIMWILIALAIVFVVIVLFRFLRK